jgi:HJR/Mrr/RecB family endonuclease
LTRGGQASLRRKQYYTHWDETKLWLAGITVLVIIILSAISGLSKLQKSDPQAFAVEIIIFSLIILLFATIPITHFWLKKKTLNEKTKNQETLVEEYKKKKLRLIQDGFYNYVTNYVTKYKDYLKKFFAEIGDTVQKLSEFSFEEKIESPYEVTKIYLRKGSVNLDGASLFRQRLEERRRQVLHRLCEDNKFTLLKELLEEKGHPFSNRELLLMVHDELRQQEYDVFKSTILQHNPVEFEDYIRIALSSYGENYSNYIDKLVKVINENNWTTPATIEMVRQYLDSSKRNLERRYFESQIENRSTRVPTIEEIDLMTGEEFEIFLEHLFTKMGYSVERTRYTQDQGADLIIRKFGEVSVVQAKRFNQLVGNGAIQEVVASIKHYKAEKGIVVTTNQFTRSAIELATSNNVNLIDRSELQKYITKYF